MSVAGAIFILLENKKIKGEIKMALKDWEPVFIGSNVECSECGITLFAGTLASQIAKNTLFSSKTMYSCDTHVKTVAPFKN